MRKFKNKCEAILFAICLSIVFYAHYKIGYTDGKKEGALGGYSVAMDEFCEIIDSASKDSSVTELVLIDEYIPDTVVYTLTPKLILLSN